MQEKRTWWKEAVVYQIYPRSFCDSNADGVGDLKGIISKLDYLKGLGADVLWLCPVYQSPNDDNGYDISDYYKIMPLFGTMADFEELLKQAHRRNLKIIMDLVVNHTSDEHAWFAQSRVSKQGAKRDYYIWRPGKNGREPNNWESFFTPSAWEFDSESGEYYLHLFSKKQPDLNWENQKVRDSIFKMMTWWLDKGIDGFRMDVINCISKTEGLPDVEPAEGYKWAGQYFLNGPKVHDYLREMNEKVLSGYDIMTVGETPGATTKDAALYAGSDGRELNMIFQSELMDIDSGENGKWDTRKWKLTDFKRVVSKWQRELYKKAWNSIFLGNHDQPRIVSRFGNDSDYREESAKMLATLLLTLSGTPYIFQGDEIGMTNFPFRSKDECRDIETIEFYDREVKSESKNSEIIKKIRAKSRDNSRTPMQWSGKENAGFSRAQPWISVNPNYREINVENEEQDENSVLSFYKKMIRIRHENPALVYGEYLPIYEDSEKIMAYLREFEGVRLMVVLNFTGETAGFSFPENFLTGDSQILSCNLRGCAPALERKIELCPYEALLIRL